MRLRGLPDKMATSNGGGMEVDGAGKYFSLILYFLPDFNTKLYADCRICFTFVLRVTEGGEFVVLQVVTR